MGLQGLNEDPSESGSSASTWAVETLGSDSDCHTDLEITAGIDDSSDSSRNLGINDVTSQCNLAEKFDVIETAAGNDIEHVFNEDISAGKNKEYEANENRKLNVSTQ